MKGPRSGAFTALIAGAICAALPFVISYSSSSIQTTNGVVVEVYYRDWIAIGCGGMAALFGLIALAVAVRASAGWTSVAAAATVLALGGFQIARGFGGFVSGASSETRIAEAGTGNPATAAADPARCPDPEACDRLAVAIEKTDPAAALAAYTRACDLGGKSSCLAAAELWDDGRAGSKDPTRSVALRLKGCELGSEDGCNDAGVAYLSGEGAAKDIARGRTLMHKGCDLGSKIACKNLAFAYRDGDDSPVDLAKSFALAVKACDEGAGVDTSVAHWVGAACTLAADALREGRGTKKDRKRAENYDRAAIDWYDSACRASAGHCYNLAVAFDSGRGVARNQKKARDLYRAACDDGNFNACNNLGVMFDRGQGGAKNIVAARELFDKACRGGVDLGCNNLKRRR
jgi:TPR repeat protein